MGEQMVSSNRGLKRRWLLALLTISIIAGAWWFWANRQITQKAIAPITADKRVLAEGIVFPIKYAQMVMPVDGTVGEVLISEGAKVKAGQPLLRLVRQEYQARVGSSRSDLARSAATIEQARVNLFDAQRELQRQQRLETAGATPRQQVDQARTTLERNQAA
ncbi:MAG: efflux transporter, family, subunit, partial [Anaerosporomusa subterranea]|nr:efflux transporter, family, subunit [Anaerosporomusa subterranea]